MGTQPWDLLSVGNAVPPPLSPPPNSPLLPPSQRRWSREEVLCGCGRACWILRRWLCDGGRRCPAHLTRGGGGGDGWVVNHGQRIGRLEGWRPCVMFTMRMAVVWKVCSLEGQGRIRILSAAIECYPWLPRCRGGGHFKSRSVAPVFVSSPRPPAKAPMVQGARAGKARRHADNAVHAWRRSPCLLHLMRSGLY